MTQLLQKLASLKLTLAVLPLLGAGILYAYHFDAWRTEALVLPLALLSLNLLAAVATHPAFRRNLPLLVFHLALLAIIILVGLARLTYLTAQVELAEGELFDAEALQNVERGPWHPQGPDRFTLANRGFSIDYAPGLVRGRTTNRLQWRNSQGQEGTSLVGDDTPLVLDGYRFYTTPNKGFAPAFVWQPERGMPMLGTVHLPPYPLHEHGQAREWQLPQTATRIWVMLQLDRSPLDRDNATRFRVPEHHRLVVRVGDDRHELRPGGSVVLPQGRLTYQGLHTWMGYTVFYDWTIPWLLAAGFLAVLSLGWHYWRAFAARPWEEPAPEALDDAGSGLTEPMRNRPRPVPVCALSKGASQ